VPSGSRWIHEIKFDGYRVQVHLHNEAVKVYTRRSHDWTNRFKEGQPHALGRRDGPKGWCVAGEGAERDDVGGDHAIPPPEAALARPGRVMAPARDPSLEGHVVAVAADRGHHFSKPSRDRILLVEGHGVEGDAHAGAFVRHRYLARRQRRLPHLRQVHLIPSELFASLSASGFKVGPGELGENITTAGLDLERMPLGTMIELGPAAIIELTGLRTPCVLIDRFQAGLKRQVLSSAETGPPFKWGVLGVVRVGGPVGWRYRAGSVPVLLLSRLAGVVAPCGSVEGRSSPSAS
jgi:MOSC domain-containing protein YiiM